MSTMRNNNRIGVENDSETVTSNTTQPTTLCEHLKRRKMMWITFTIIVLVMIITIPIVMVETKKTNSETTSTTEEMEATTGS
ncbi:unnamed protein product [Adineta steineri]|uniref:Uncharacterized protein n=1 Tax=Adineta steineri TaxID=433720 RepID=A0A816BM30_9BILA|nr:unnamed protein product [Adineta steineri]CAF1610849.1 unnamed protein product [Adineta steineri]CAF1611640.1 unnamed protein product [Adineta steineri]